MSFWKKVLLDLFFVVFYYILYKILGFEFAVIIALAQIISHLIQKEYPKKSPQMRSFYSTQKRNRI